MFNILYGVFHACSIFFTEYSTRIQPWATVYIVDLDPTFSIYKEGTNATSTME